MSENVKNKKKKIIIADLIGPIISIENILILVFYFWWNYIINDKPGLISYIIIYLMVFIGVLLVAVSFVSLLMLLTKKISISKNLRNEKMVISIVGAVLGLIILLFTDTIANSIGEFNTPIKTSDSDIVQDISRIGGE